MGCVQSKKYQPYCPNCNSNENVIEIIYGYPTEEGMEDFRHGLKHLGVIPEVQTLIAKSVKGPLMAKFNDSLMMKM